jgi:hypothetical protein
MLVPSDPEEKTAFEGEAVFSFPADPQQDFSNV